MQAARSRRVGQRAALLCAGLGLLLAATLCLLFGLGSELRYPQVQLLVGAAVVVELGCALGLGGRAGLRIQAGKSALGQGVALALSCVALPTVLLSLAVWVAAGPRFSMGLNWTLRDLSSYILKPLYWIGVFGFLPACSLGVLYAWLVRRALRQPDPTG